MKGLFNLGRIGTSEAIQSDFAKKKIKGMADKYIDQILDIFTSNVSKKKIMVAVFLSTKQLLNFQNQNQVSHFLDINTQDHTTLLTKN